MTIFEKGRSQVVLRYTHSLTPWDTVLHGRLSGSQPVKKLPAFYGTRRFITAFTTARHLSISFALYFIRPIKYSK